MYVPWVACAISSFSLRHGIVFHFNLFLRVPPRVHRTHVVTLSVARYTAVAPGKRRRNSNPARGVASADGTSTAPAVVVLSSDLQSHDAAVWPSRVRSHTVAARSSQTRPEVVGGRVAMDVHLVGVEFVHAAARGSSARAAFFASSSSFSLAASACLANPPRPFSRAPPRHRRRRAVRDVHAAHSSASASSADAASASPASWRTTRRRRCRSARSAPRRGPSTFLRQRRLRALGRVLAVCNKRLDLLDLFAQPADASLPRPLRRRPHRRIPRTARR